MLVEALDDAFLGLVTGQAPVGLQFAQTGWETNDVLLMLRQRACAIRAVFEPAAWLIVEHGLIAGMCSILSVSALSGTIEIGYGVAPICRGRGTCTRAIADIVLWATNDPRVDELTAETSVDNVASQRVLQRNGFTRTGERVSPDDGPVIAWALQTPSTPAA